MVDITLTTKDDVGNFRQTIWATDSEVTSLNVTDKFLFNYESLLVVLIIQLGYSITV